MINLTKAEMEDIWQNKPYGYWTQLRKINKGKKRFKVKIQPYTYNNYEVREVMVMAKNKDSAFDEAKFLLYDEYKPTGLDGWRLIKAELV
jgi:hypothetical protein